jgi:hypothetical protein
VGGIETAEHSTSNPQHSTSKEEKNRTEKYRQKTFSDENLIDRIPYWKLSFESSIRLRRINACSPTASWTFIFLT